MLLTGGYYDYYRERSKEHGWGTLFNQLFELDQGIYHILLNVAVFAAGTAFLCAVVLLALTAGGGRSSKEFAEAKKWIIRILVISILTFAVTGLVTLVGMAGLDN